MESPWLARLISWPLGGERNCITDFVTPFRPHLILI